MPSISAAPMPASTAALTPRDTRSSLTVTKSCGSSASRPSAITPGPSSALSALAYDWSSFIDSKGTVIRMTEAMAAELREQHINVNCVLPTIIDTPENRAAMPNADPAKWVAPADLANVMVFLASDAARAVHGAAVPVTSLS